MNDDLPLALTLLVLGLSPLAVPILRGRRGRLKKLAIGVMVLSLAGFVLGATVINSRPKSPPPPSDIPRTVLANEYVGADTCLSCHPYEHATWHATYHRTMTQVASPESVLAPFDGTDLYLEGVTWRLERRGDEFWVKGRDGTSEKEMRVAMTTGSHNYQLYWLESYGESGLQQFPLVYLLYDKIWIPRKSRFLQPPRESTPSETGRWKSHCIKCHATGGITEHLPSGETRVAELGISCEACHGPGSKHAAANRTPLRRYQYHLNQEPDPTIVNPRRLPHERSTEVCGQCHGIEIFLDQQTAKDWTHEGSRFRPGDKLSEFQTTMVGRYRDNLPEVRKYLDNHENFRLRFCFWSDGTLRVAGREYQGMVETPCYQRGEMSCLSCHAMHRSEDDSRSLQTWADDLLDSGMRGDRACLQCHQQYEDPVKVTAHTHHVAESSGSVCYNCHMPYTTWGLLRAIRSHTVDSPSVAASLATGRPNACNQCHLDQTLQWTAEHLEKWYGMAPPDLSDDERNTAASILWALSGDAGQRALMAWSMGWGSARQVSGTDWMVPFLAALMRDPYHAVRFNAQRSLRAYSEYTDVTTDSVTGATEKQQWEMVKQILPHWEGTFQRPPGGKPRLLIRPDGKMDPDKFRRLVEQRNNQEMVLFE